MVTGAGGGIGSAVAARLAAGSATVAAVDLNPVALTEQVAKLAADGRRARGYPADVSDPAAVEAMVERVERELGPVDILVNVAGVLRTGPVTGLSDEDWATVFSVNANGVFYTSRAVARRMADRRGGVIVTVGSNAAAVPRMHMAAYCASKAASTAFTKCLGLEMSEYGIRCNVVAPGSTQTPMLRSMWRDGYDASSTVDGSLRAYRVGIPLRRLAEPADVAAAVVFLASDQARHITMHELYVDGGAALGA